MFQRREKTPGGTLMLSYIGSVHFGYLCPLSHFVKNFEFQYFGGFQRNDYFWGMTILWIFWGAIAKLDYILGHFYVFRVIL